MSSTVSISVSVTEGASVTITATAPQGVTVSVAPQETSVETDHPTTLVEEDTSKEVPTFDASLYKYIVERLTRRYAYLRATRISDGEVFRIKRLVKNHPRGSVYIPEIWDEDIPSEYRIFKDVVHPQIPKVYDLFQDEDSVYIAMEYPRGRSLDQLSDLTPQQAVHVFRQLVEIVMYLHANGIAHRQIKPKNVLIDEDFKVTLLPSKIPLRIDPEDPLVDPAKGGTIYCQSPETFSMDPHDAKKADVWCLGIVFHLLLTDELPFHSKGIMELIREILYKEPFVEIPTGELLEYPLVCQKLVCQLMEKGVKERISLEDVLKSECFTDPESFSRKGCYNRL